MLRPAVVGTEQPKTESHYTHEPYVARSVLIKKSVRVYGKSSDEKNTKKSDELFAENQSFASRKLNLQAPLHLYDYCMGGADGHVATLSLYSYC